MLDQRIDAGDAQATLQLADLGAVERGADAQLLLREVGSFATAA
jgi:hypothetical protein